MSMHKKITGKDGKRYAVKVLKTSDDGSLARIAIRHYVGFSGNMRREYRYGRAMWVRAESLS